jgi:maltooligosyltrehalose synthase
VARILADAEGGQAPWEGTWLLLPGGSGGVAWIDVFTGTVHRPVMRRGQPALPLVELLAELPVALLHPAP